MRQSSRSGDTPALEAPTANEGTHVASSASNELRTAALVATIALAIIGLVSVASPPLLIVGLLLTVVVGLAAWSPLGVTSAVLVSLPWFYRPATVGTQSFPASELLLFATCAGLATRITIDAVRADNLSPILASLRQVITSRLVTVLAILVSAGAVGAMRPYDVSHRADSLREWRWVLLEPLLLLGLASIVILRPHERKFAAASLIVGACLAALYGIGDVIWNTGVAADGVNRVTGSYPHPNALAMYFSRITALAGAWMVFDPRARKVLLAPVLLVSAMTIATYSRGAFLALGAASVASLAGVPRRLRPAVLALPATAALVGVITARDRMLDLLGGGSGSLRLDIWTSALQMIADRPIRGYGPDQFLYAYLPRYIAPTAWQERFTSHAHNIFLDFWIRLGIIGFAFIACAVAVCLVALVGAIRRRDSVHSLRAASIVALVAIVVHGLVDNAYFSHDLAMSTWLIAWLAFGPEMLDSAEGADDSARPRFGRRRFHWLSPVR
jgi:putative inorganic carbon (hco3(-)) transporter